MAVILTWPQCVKFLTGIPDQFDTDILSSMNTNVYMQSTEIMNLVNPMKFANGFVMFCFNVVYYEYLVDSCDYL